MDLSPDEHAHVAKHPFWRLNFHGRAVPEGWLKRLTVLLPISYLVGIVVPGSYVPLPHGGSNYETGVHCFVLLATAVSFWMSLPALGIALTRLDEGLEALKLLIFLLAIPALVYAAVAVSQFRTVPFLAHGFMGAEMQVERSYSRIVSREGFCDPDDGFDIMCLTRRGRPHNIAMIDGHPSEFSAVFVPDDVMPSFDGRGTIILTGFANAFAMRLDDMGFTRRD